MSKKSKDKNYLKLRDPIDNLDFGRLIAEQDDNLAEYYVADDRYLKRALNVDDAAVFFVGPKGIGKSAILQMVRIRKSTEENRIINLKPDDLAFSALANAEATSPILTDAGRNQWLFKSLWDYVLALEILKREYPDTNSLKGWFASKFGTQHDRECRRLISMSQGDREGESLTARILQLIKELELSGEVGGAKLSGKAVLDKSKSSGDAFQLLSVVNTVAKRLPDKLKHNYYVLIDDLDLYWSDSTTQNAFIAALFTSLRHFSRPPYLKAVVALRENIYDVLPLIDRDKLHDSVCLVRWTYDAVREMIERRVLFKLQISSVDDVWGGVFPVDAFAQIWKHSNGRPREAIRIATLAALLASEEGHLQIQSEDMDKAIHAFSKERIREIADENATRFPGLEHVIRKMNGWPKEFDFNRLREWIEYIDLEVQDKLPGAEHYAWLSGFATNPVGFATALLEVNVLWIKKSRSDVAQQYDPKNPVEITTGCWFAIHPMFGPALGLIGA